MHDPVFVAERRIVDLSDGTTMQMWKQSGQSEEDFQDMVKYYKQHPAEARRVERFNKDSKQFKSWLLQREIASYYAQKCRAGDQAVTSRMVALEKDAELRHMYEDIKSGGKSMLIAHTVNEPMMMKLNRVLGGVPNDLRARLKVIQDFPVTVQEACKEGNVQTVREYLGKWETAGEEANAYDSQGVACLGYAIGANRTGVVKLLLDVKADYKRVDKHGASALHYAAAYGRCELLEFFIQAGGDVNGKNAQGHTPLALAMQNRQKETTAIMKMYGGDLN